MARGEKTDQAALAKPPPISEIRFPRPALSNEEKLAQESEASVGTHLEAERGFNRAYGHPEGRRGPREARARCAEC